MHLVAAAHYRFICVRKRTKYATKSCETHKNEGSAQTHKHTGVCGVIPGVHVCKSIYKLSSRKHKTLFNSCRHKESERKSERNAHIRPIETVKYLMLQLFHACKSQIKPQTAGLRQSLKTEMPKVAGFPV